MDNNTEHRISVRLVLASASALAALGMWPTTSTAETDARWSVRMGYARASFDTASTISVADQTAPGATVAIGDQTVLLGDVGFAFNDHWTGRLAVGSPIDLQVAAGGSLKALSPPLTGTLGEMQVAPVVVSALYSPRPFGRLRPYAGAGLTYAWVRETESGDVHSLRATSEWGVVVQAGCDATLGQRWSAFVDARKLYVDTTATGVITALGGVPVMAAVNLDPLILNVGVGYSF